MSQSSNIFSFQQSFNNKLQKLLIFTLGKFNYLNIKDISYVFNRVQQKSNPQLLPDKQEQIYIQSMQKNISTYLAVGAVSSIGLNFLLQKLSPKFQSLTGGRLLIDLGLASICVGTGMYLSLTSIEPDLNKLKKSFLQKKDIHFIRYIKQQSIIYDIDMQNQIKRFLNDNEYSIWSIKEGVKMLELVL